MNERMRGARWLLVAALVAAAMASGALADDVRPDVHGRLVVVLALPGSLADHATPDTQRLALEIADRLRAAEFRVEVAGVSPIVPLEELIATANASSTDLTLGVRSLGFSKSCAAAITPERVPRPAQSEGAVANGELAPLLKQLMASARAEASASLASGLASGARWCPRKPTEVERYVLGGTLSPTLLLSVASPEAGEALARVAEIVAKWFAMEQK
jgi:hypothetical protein